MVNVKCTDICKYSKNCGYFKAELNQLTFYTEGRRVDDDVQVKCTNEKICANAGRMLKGGAQDE